MANEIAFILIIILSLLSVFISGIFGKYGLLSVVIILAIISSITAGKLISLFGVATSIATPIYAGIFLATDALSEIYSKDDAKKAVWIGLFANVVLLSLGQLIVSTPAYLNVELSDALTIIFNFIPRLVTAGLIAFIIAQRFDIWLFHKIKEKQQKNEKWYSLAIRNNLSTICSQGIDSLIVYTIAFWGIIPDNQILALILTAWGFKIIVALMDTPFLYLLKNIQKKVA
jgi:uncharacterized integral membrane protein (TIGR00697 family)